MRRSTCSARCSRRSRIGLLNHAKADPDLDPLRDDPRFKAMIAAAEARLAAAAEAGTQAHG